MASSQSKIEIVRLLAQVEHAGRRFLKDAEAASAAELLPECVAPVPATRRVQLEFEEKPRVLPPGTPLVPMKEESSRIRWRTCFPVSTAPWNVTGASTSAGSSGYAWPDRIESDVRSVLCLKLSATCDATGHDLMTLALEGKPAQTFALFQTLTRDLLAVYVRAANGPLLAVNCRPLVQDPANELLPAIDGLPAGSRLLTSLFLNPNALLVLEFSDMAKAAAARELELIFALRTSIRAVSSGSFRSRCVPVRNELERAIPLLEIDATQDEWPLTVPAGELIHALVFVKGYDPETGEWPTHEGWRLVFRGSGARRHAKLAFQDNLFTPQSPPSRFVQFRASCNQGAHASLAPEGEELEADCGAIAKLLGAGSVAIQTRNPRLAQWFTSGFAEPLHAKSFRRLLFHQSLLRGSVAHADERAENLRRKRARKWIDGIRLLSVAGDDVLTPTGLYRGRKITLEVRPDAFPGGGCWLAVMALDVFLSLHNELNEFTRLVIITEPQGEEYSLPPRWGRRAAL
jgi:hypothetical protein